MIKYLLSSVLCFAVFCGNAQDKKSLSQEGKPSSVAPQYPGGVKEFYKFVYSNFRMPDIVRENDTIIKVSVRFIVDTDGSLRNIKVIKDPGFGLGEEAVRVVGLSKKWEPGSSNGRPVMTPYMVPITLNFTGTGPIAPIKGNEVENVPKKRDR